MSIPLPSNAPQASYLPPLLRHTRILPPPIMFRTPARHVPRPYSSYPAPQHVMSCALFVIPAPQHVMSCGPIRHSRTHPILFRTPTRHIPHPNTSYPAPNTSYPAPQHVISRTHPIMSCTHPIMSRTPTRHIPHPNTSFPRRREPPPASQPQPKETSCNPQSSIPNPLLDRAKRGVLQSRHHAA